ncbi:MAG: AI-2E family transporter [Lachnospiraceae bacterium]|nr:AI-2E family transporter [Lachnospiraceae bacterium]
METKRTNNHYLRLMLALFGAAALAILLFFIVFRFNGIRSVVKTLINVLMPFIVGAVLAYILKPSCNYIEEKLTAFFSKQSSRNASSPARPRRPRAAKPLNTLRGRVQSNRETCSLFVCAGRVWRKPQNTLRAPVHKNAPMKLIPGLSVLITMVLGLAVVFTLLIMVLPTLLETVYLIVRQIPKSIEGASEWLLKYAGDNETLSNYITELSESFSTSIPDWIQSTLIPNIEVLIGNLQSGVSGLVAMLSNMLMGLIAAIYILGSRKKFAAQAKLINYSIFGKKWSERILEEVRYADRVFSGFINGRLIDSLIIGIICFVGMLLLRLPYAILISVIVGITNIIPFFGPYIGAVPSFLLILMVSPVKAVIFLIFVLILQQFDGNILGPRILGNVTGLSSFWVLFAILTFGGLFGFVGMIVGVPVFAVIYDIIRKVVLYGVKQQKLKEEKNAPAPQSGT